jgi:hypothetical protein
LDGDLMDLTGSGHDGTAIDSRDSTAKTATYQDDVGRPSGEALSLDGSTVVTLADSSVLQTASDFTMAAWIRIASPTTPDYQNIITMEGNWTCGDNVQFRVEYTNTSTFRITIAEGHCHSSEIIIPIEFETWHHLVLVRDGSELLVYLDGALAHSGNPGCVANLTNIYPLALGGRYSGCFSDQDYEHSFVGAIDDFRWYDRALSAQEVGE